MKELTPDLDSSKFMITATSAESLPTDLKLFRSFGDESDDLVWHVARAFYELTFNK